MLLAPEKGERRTLQQVFTFQDDRIIGKDLNLLADHISVGGTTESAIQDRPDRRFWMTRSDGQLLCLLYDPDQQVISWSRHIKGGNTPVVESIATINENTEDQLWAITKRVINGATRRYVEFMEQTFDVDDKLEDAFFVDSGLTLNANKTITGASNSNPVTITAAAHGFSNGDSVRIRNLKGLTLSVVNDDDSVTVTDPINDVSFTIGNVQTNTFTLLGLECTTLDPYLSAAHANADCPITPWLMQLARAPATTTAHAAPGPALGLDGTRPDPNSSAGGANEEVPSITGRIQLAGETVNIMANGASVPATLVDSDGTLTLPKAASIVHIGLPVVSLMRTMPIVDTTGDSDSRSGFMQLHEVFLMVDRSLGGAIGTQTGEYNEFIYRTAVDEMGESLGLFTGFLDGGF